MLEGEEDAPGTLGSSGAPRAEGEVAAPDLETATKSAFCLLEIIEIILLFVRHIAVDVDYNHTFFALK